MSLKYTLLKNHLTENPDDYMAMPQGNDSVDQGDIIDVMIARGSTVTKAEALSGKEEEASAIEAALKRGQSVNTPLVNISLSISGVFESDEDRFDPTRHRVKVNVAPGTRLKAIASEIEVEYVSPQKTLPELRKFIDFVSDTTNTTLTPGGGGRLQGSSLKVDKDDPKQGVFFVATDGTATRVTQLMRNKPSELIFMIPNNLPAGAYTVEVRTVFSENGDIRTGRLNDSLSVSVAP